MPNLYPFLIYVIVTTFTPGPNNIMAMTNAMHDGFKELSASYSEYLRDLL